MDFDRPVIGFEQSELGINGFRTSVTVTKWETDANDKVYTTTVKADKPGSVTFTIPANAVQAVDDGQANLMWNFLVIIENGDDIFVGIISGNNQIAAPGTTLKPWVVQVFRNRKPEPNAVVTFEFRGGCYSGSLSANNIKSGVDGMVTTTFTLAPQAPANYVFVPSAITTDGQKSRCCSIITAKAIADTCALKMASMPKKTALFANYPNPFNPETWIPYQLSKPENIIFTIYNVRGVVVRQLGLGYQTAGTYYNRVNAAYWDGRNNIGEKVATELYYLKFSAGEYTETYKMLIRK